MHSLKIALALIVCSFTACESLIPTPAEELAGYKAAAPVISALERFRQDHGHYPATLRELMPRYIRHVQQAASASYDPSAGFQYHSEGDRYGLNFSYFTKQAAEWRSYSSADKKWHSATVYP
jgi:hypothetical protein